MSIQIKLLGQLSDLEQTLVRQSLDAMKNAYAKYSNFQVGAAIKFADGQVVTGCNVENSSYGLTICAERTALVKAISEGKQMDLEAVAVSAATNAQIVSPCGACRQFIAEFGPNVPVYMHNPVTGEVAIAPMSVLLPGCFDLRLERNDEVAK